MKICNRMSYTGINNNLLDLLKLELCLKKAHQMNAMSYCQFGIVLLSLAKNVCKMTSSRPTVT